MSERHTAPGERYRCWVYGCPQYGQWMPVQHDGDRRHYLTHHYQPHPAQPQPRGTHPKETR